MSFILKFIYILCGCSSEGTDAETAYAYAESPYERQSQQQLLPPLGEQHEYGSVRQDQDTLHSVINERPGDEPVRGKGEGTEGIRSYAEAVVSSSQPAASRGDGVGVIYRERPMVCGSLFLYLRLDLLNISIFSMGRYFPRRQSNRIFPLRAQITLPRDTSITPMGIR